MWELFKMNMLTIRKEKSNHKTKLTTTRTTETNEHHQMEVPISPEYD